MSWTPQIRRHKTKTKTTQHNMSWTPQIHKSKTKTKNKTNRQHHMCWTPLYAKKNTKNIYKVYLILVGGFCFCLYDLGRHDTADK